MKKPIVAVVPEGSLIAPYRYRQLGETSRRAFTLIELLVAISIISVLSAILLPALGKARRHARSALNMSNQKQIARALNNYAADNSLALPDSVATIGFGFDWNWQEPMMITGYQSRSPRGNRSMSEYLRSYLPDAKVLYCPNAPDKYEYFEAAWAAGEQWDNPDTPIATDAISGTYCFFYNYTAYAVGKPRLFRGPTHLGAGHNQSDILVSCYLGYDHYSARGSYRSCEPFGSARISEGTFITASFWAAEKMKRPEIRLTSAYADGHVEKVPSTETNPLRAIYKPRTAEPYPPHLGPGLFYVPTKSLR